jgi:UDP-3-O-[3-hydroxymyristoyl] glucosamine N-acyltransferase
MLAQGIPLSELVAQFGGELIGDPHYRVQQVATLQSAGPQDISFCHRGKYAEALARTRAGAVIVAPADKDRTRAHRIVAADPYVYFARVSAHVNPRPSPTPGVHPSAFVHVEAAVSPLASIGAQCSIARGVRIGAGVAVGPGTSIGEDATIGPDTRIDANVTIYASTVIGERCVLLAGAVIGSDGFGFARTAEGWLKVPQIGRVVIGDDVEVGANTTIDRGALDDTVLENGVKLDNQIQIGHNCRIGARTAIAGCVGIAGSTTIGRDCLIGGAAMIAGHLAITDRVIVSGGTLISRSINEPGTYTGVYPFEPNKRWSRNAALLRHLDESAARIRTLERRIAELERTK